jgi:phospholipid-binding lipoprotein MlaA
LLAVGLAVLVLSGCATEGVRVRRLPDETPAADIAAQIAQAQTQRSSDELMKPSAPDESTAAGATGGAARSGTSAPTSTGGGNAPSPPSGADTANALPPLTAADAPSMYTYDPLERVNRFTYRFNARFDEHVFLPVANGYRRFPGPVRSGVHHFFRNLGEITSTANYILQWRLGNGARSLGRFVLNTTLGIGGLFDVASKLKLPGEQTGFGGTLSTWGVHPGPYLVIPLLGPSTLRDGIGLLGDYGLQYGVNFVDLYRGYQSYGLGVVNAVDQRAHIDFRYYGSGSPFEYETIRFLYVHRDLIQDEALRKRHTPRDPRQPAGK